MAQTVESYVRQFYQLEGTTFGERRCAFNHYFKAVTSFLSTPEDVKAFFANLKPRNRLEEILHLFLLQHYKQRDQLLEILYNEDCVLIKLLLKKGALLIEDTFKDADAAQFLDFMSKVSFVVRCKICTRLSKMAEVFENNKLDCYYFALKEKYGLNFAKTLLCGCSVETIKAELEEHKIMFSNNQLTRIYARSADFLEDYFAHLKKNNQTDFRNFAQMIKKVVLTNEGLYWKLLEQHELDIKLSYKQTIIVLEKHKDEILKDTDKYLAILNKHAIVASLNTEEFKVFLAQILPKTIDEFEVDEVCNDYTDPVFYLSKFATKSKRFEILQDVFKSKYNANILDHEEFVNELVLELVPIKDRLDIIEKKLQKDPSEDGYIAFYETDKALELLKMKISHTTVANTRMDYVGNLVKVCKVNNDMKRLPEVLDYILKRHKNEDSSFYAVIFRSINDNCKLSKFDQKMWDTINSMVEAFKIRFKIFEYTFQTFEEAYMKFKDRNGISIVEDVSKTMKDFKKDNFYWCRFWGDSLMTRLCIDAMPEIIPKLFEGKDLQKAISFYCNTVKYYNRNHKKRRIDVFKEEFVVKYWEEEIANDKSDKSCIFDDLTFVRSRPDLLKKITKLIWEGKRTENYQWRWFLKYQPQDIVLNYEKFFEDKLDNRSGLRRFPYNVTYFSHLGIPELFYKKSCELLQTEDLPGKSHQYVAAVKFLVHHKDFVQIVQPLLPQDYPINPSPNENNSIEVRQAISRVIGTYKEKSNALDTLAVIAKGDYLQYALFSMHKIMHHTPEYKLKHFLEKIAGGSVSLRKHVIFILSGISTVRNVYETFKKIGETEENHSVKTYLLHSTLQYFQVNPSEEFFELTKQHARLLEPANVEGYDKLVELRNIPIPFISRYVEFVWESIMESTDKSILKLRYKLLANINKIIMEQMNDEMLHKFVIRCLDFEKVGLWKVYDFVYRYITDRDVQNVAKRIDLVVTQFPERRNNLKKARVARNVCKFIIAFCKEIIKKKNDEKSNDIDAKRILTEFADACSKNASFQSLVWLKLTKWYLETPPQDHKSFIRDFDPFYTTTVNKLSVFITHTLAEIFSDFIATFIAAEKLKLPENLLDFSLQFLDNDSTIEKELFVLLILPKTVSKSENVLEKHVEIMKLLNESKSEVVQTAISRYLESVSYVKKKEKHVNHWRCQGAGAPQAAPHSGSDSDSESGSESASDAE